MGAGWGLLLLRKGEGWEVPVGDAEIVEEFKNFAKITKEILETGKQLRQRSATFLSSKKCRHPGPSRFFHTNQRKEGRKGKQERGKQGK